MPGSLALETIRQHYTVTIPDPHSHLLHITLRLLDVTAPVVLKMPVWTPGSYLVREYARHVQNVEVALDNGQTLPLSHTSKNTWQILGIPTDTSVDVVVSYQVYAAELTVRTNHVDGTHAYFNGAATFLYLPERRWEPLSLTVIPPQPDWQTATALPRLNEKSFVAETYDQLVDSPVEVGQHERFDFEVLGQTHTWVLWGESDLDRAQLVADTAKIVETTASLWGGLPYNHYLFLLHLVPEGMGGLEHRDSTSLIYTRFGHRDPERYQGLLALIAHEFFHTWNIKRLRPKALETFNYDQETYLTSLWFAEGATSYYENMILVYAGLISPERCLQLLGKQITRLQLAPGRQVQSLAESSWDTWIKLYRPHENTLNSQISYYLKGSLVTWLLDLTIRDRSAGQADLGTVFQDLWQRFGRWEKGYSDHDLQAAFEKAAGGSLQEFFQDAIYGTQELDYDRYLAPFGLRVRPQFSQSSPVPYVGLRWAGEGSRISAVEQGSPAQAAGLWAGDEVVALNGYKINAARWSERLRSYQPGDTVEITFFQQERLQTRPLVLRDPQPDLYIIEPLPSITGSQAQHYRSWMRI